MSTDRELLELAARAAGYAVTPHPNHRVSASCVFVLNGGNWNPLTDDGDALRLMVKLNLVLKECCNSEECYPQGYGRKKVIEFFVAQDGNTSQLEAARRAIVRAAAAIGAKS